MHRRINISMDPKLHDRAVEHARSVHFTGLSDYITRLIVDDMRASKKKLAAPTTPRRADNGRSFLVYPSPTGKWPDAWFKTELDARRAAEEAVTRSVPPPQRGWVAVLQIVACCSAQHVAWDDGWSPDDDEPEAKA